MDGCELIEDPSRDTISPSSSSDSIGTPSDLKELLNKLLEEATSLEREIRGRINHIDAPENALTALCIQLNQNRYHAVLAVPKTSRLARLRGSTPTANGRTVYVSSYEPYARIAFLPTPPRTESTIYRSSLPTALPASALGASIWDGRNGSKVTARRAVYTFNSVNSSSGCSAASDCLSGRSLGGSSSSGASDSSENDCEESEIIVVEMQLRDLFRVAPAVDAYNSLLNIIPEVWVGSMSRLLKLAKRMCEEIHRNFRVQGMEVPPWRRLDAFVRRWELEACTVQLPIAPTPSSVFATITTRSTITVPDFD